MSRRTLALCFDRFGGLVGKSLSVSIVSADSSGNLLHLSQAHLPANLPCFVFLVHTGSLSFVFYCPDGALITAIPMENTYGEPLLQL